MNNMKTIASVLCTLGKQFLNDLLIKIIEESFVYCFKRFLKKQKHSRINKTSKQRAKKYLALSLSVVMAFGLYAIIPKIHINYSDSQTTSPIGIIQIRGADNEEVRKLPPYTVMCSKQLRKFGETLYAMTGITICLYRSFFC